MDPRNKKIEAKTKQLDALQVQISEGRAAKQKLPQFREEVRRLELELEKLLRILPARRNTPELLRRIRQLTEQGNFDLLRFTPGNFTDRDFYSEWPIAIKLNGSYHNLALFFDRVGRFSRIVNIENLKIAAPAEQPEGALDQRSVHRQDVRLSRGAAAGAGHDAEGQEERAQGEGK